MAKKRSQPILPEQLRALVEETESRVLPEDVDVYGRLQEIQDRSLRTRTIIEAWKAQQEQDRQMREQYARWLMIGLAVQAILMNVLFVLMGFGIATFEEWTARTFIVAVFGEIAAMVLLIVRYLYRPTSDKILDLLQERRRKER